MTGDGDAPGEERSRADAAQASRLGAIAIFAAKGYFLIASMALGFGLINQLTPAEYGRFFLVNDVVSLTGAVLLAGALQAMSRHVAREPDRVYEIRRTGLATFGRVGLAASIGLALGAWPIAWFLGDETLAPLVLLAAPIPLCYSLYAAHIGVINGCKRFGTQAVFDMGFATVKVGLMIAAAALGFGAFGVLGGFTITTAVVLVLATRASRAGSPGERFPTKALLAFSLVTLVYVFAINTVLRADAWLVKRGFDDTSAGLYMVSLQIGRVPYQLSVAVALVMFPFLAAGGGERSVDETRRLTERALRYGLALAGLAAGLLIGTGRELLYVLDPAKAVAAPVLYVVGPAMLAYTLNYLICTVLVSRGRPGRAAVVSGVTLALTVLLVRVGIVHPLGFLLPGGGDLPDGMLGAAHGVAVANGLGLIVALWALHRETGVGPTWRLVATLALVGGLLAAGIAWEPAGELVTASGEPAPRGTVLVWALVKLAALGVGGVGVLLASRILPPAEAKALLLRR